MRLILANSGRRWIGEVGHCALLYRELVRRGHHVWLVCRRGQPLEAQARREGWPHLALQFSGGFRPWGDGGDAWALYRLLRREQIELIHAHRGKDHWLAAAAALPAGVPIVRTRHVVTPVRQHPFNRWLYRHATAALVSVSRAAEASLGPLVERVPLRRTILSAVDLEAFHPRRRSDGWRSDPARRLGADEIIWVGLIGRFQAIKGQRVFLEAAERVAAACPQARFFMSGRSRAGKRRKFRDLAQRAGFGDRLRLQGWLTDVPEAMASLDLGVVASLGSEGSSRVTLEYMASGVAVVASAVGGIPEILAPGDGEPFGRLVPPGDASALAEALVDLARDGCRRRRLALRGRHQAEARHGPAAWAEAIEAVYRQVLAARRLPSTAGT